MLDTVAEAVFTERSKCINCGSADLNEFASGRYADEPLQGFIAADPWGENPMPYLRSATWSLVRCKSCSQMFHRRILNEEWNERRFSQWMNPDSMRAFAKQFGSRHRIRFNTAIHQVEHVLRIDQATKNIRGDADPVRLLDFGCGAGFFLETCARFDFDGVGVDRSVGRREEARIKIAPSLDEIEGSFHCITLFEVMEHLDEPAAILHLLIDRLMPGGLLILETPDCAGLTGIQTRRDYLLAHPLEHINCFTHDTLKSMGERFGLKQIARPSVFVLTGVDRAAKRYAKYLLGKDGKSTQLYFRKG